MGTANLRKLIPLNPASHRHLYELLREYLYRRGNPALQPDSVSVCCDVAGATVLLLAGWRHLLMRPICTWTPKAWCVRRVCVPSLFVPPISEITPDSSRSVRISIRCGVGTIGGPKLDHAEKWVRIWCGFISECGDASRLMATSGAFAEAKDRDSLLRATLASYEVGTLKTHGGMLVRWARWARASGRRPWPPSRSDVAAYFLELTQLGCAPTRLKSTLGAFEAFRKTADLGLPRFPLAELWQD